MICLYAPHVSFRWDPLLSTQVKREEIEESVSAQARLEGAATSLSEDILRYRSRLADFKEALECSICLEHTVRERGRERGRETDTQTEASGCCICFEQTVPS